MPRFADSQYVIMDSRFNVETLCQQEMRHVVVGFAEASSVSGGRKKTGNFPFFEWRIFCI
jgi:hypothetical protein